MSFDILYNKQFIKVDADHVIPFMEAGCSNLYTGSKGQEKRVREWSNSYGFTGSKLIVSNTTLLANIDKLGADIRSKNEGTVTDACFGYHSGIALYGKSTRNTTFGAFRAFYATGIKEAMTIEELKEKNVTISIEIPYWNEDAILAKGKKLLPPVTLLSTEHMLEVIKEYTEYYNGVMPIYLKSSWGMENIILQRKRAKQDRIRTPKSAYTVNEYYVLLSDVGYFIKNMKYGYKYQNHVSQSVKVFITKEQADKFLDTKVRNKDKFAVTKISRERVFYK